MRNLKKKILIMICGVLLLALTGCANLDIETGIDEDYNAKIAYALEVDFASMSDEQAKSLSNSLDNLVKQFANVRDFEILENEGDVDSGKGSYKIEKVVPNDNFEDAFASLKELLTDEKTTPFMQVDMTSKITDYQHLYHFNGELDFAKILGASNIDSFPPMMQEHIVQGFEASAGQVKITLPGAEIENVSATADSLDGTIDGQLASITAPFKFNQQTSMELTTKLTVENGKAVNGTMEDVLHMHELSKWLWLGIGALGFVIVAIGALLHLNKEKTKLPMEREGAPNNDNLKDEI